MFNKNEKIILILLFCIHFVMITDFMIIMPMAPHIMEIFAASSVQLSLLITTFTLAAGLVGLVSARWLDQFNHKKLLIIASLGFIIGNVACALSTQLWHLTWARGLTGGFVGILGSLMLTLLSNNIPTQLRGKAIGIVMSAFALASIVGVPLCLFLYQKFTWAAPFWLLSFITIIILILIIVKLPQLTQHQSQKHFELIKNHDQKWAVVFIILLILGHFTINPFLFVSLIQNAKIPQSELTPIYLFAGLGSILSSLLSGYLVDKKGAVRILTWSLVLSLISIFAVTHLTPSNVLWATISTTTFFVLMGARMTAAMTWILSKSNLENRGSFMSLINSFQHISAALGAMIAGQIVEKNLAGEIEHFNQVGYVAIFFSLIALCIPLKIEKNLGSLKS